MTNLPLHPVVVHVPLGIAVILPLVALGAAVAIWKRRWPWSAWAVVLGLQVLMAGSAALALWSGEQEEERVEAVVNEAAIEQHEERAEAFFWAAGVLLLPSLGVLVLRREGARRALSATVGAGALVLVGLAVWTGHSGGQLVYSHGAAAAYSSGGVSGAGGLGGGDSPAGGPGRRSLKDDDD